MDSNPFSTGTPPDEDEAMSDPFDDPSLADASAYGHHEPEEYNPFTSKDESAYSTTSSSKSSTSKPSSSSSSKPSSSSSSSSSKASSSSSSSAWFGSSGGNNSEKRKGSFPGASESSYSGSISTDSELQRKIKELERREQALKEREREVDDRERIAREMLGSRMPYNWPFKRWALLYHDIDAEIPGGYQKLIKQFYAYIIWVWICLGWNLITCTTAWFSGLDGYDNGDVDTIWSAVYVLCGVPGAWKLWYRGIYFGCRDNSGGRWIFFFINFFGHLIFTGVVLISIPKCGGGGIILMINAFKGGKNVLGYFCLTNVLLWGLSIVSGIWLIKRAHLIWKHSGVPEQTKRAVAEAVVKESLNQNLIDSAA